MVAWHNDISNNTQAAFYSVNGVMLGSVYNITGDKKALAIIPEGDTFFLTWGFANSGNGYNETYSTNLSITDIDVDASNNGLGTYMIKFSAIAPALGIPIHDTSGNKGGLNTINWDYSGGLVNVKIDLLYGIGYSLVQNIVQILVLV